jgi:PIN domain nuclease of toxin-antitoxin system
VKILLDTHVLLWAATEPQRLGGSLELLTSAVRLISVASVWELAIKQGIGKLDLGSDVATWVGRAAFHLAADVVDITAAHAAGVQHLPPVHRDPFDRLLISQARVEGAIFLTADRTLAAYGDAVRLID